MTTRQRTARWVGLALAGGIITFTAATHAVKPIKPPPEPPPATTYNLIYLDAAWSFRAGGINESGLVFGSTYIAGGSDHSTLLVPLVEDGSALWFKDDDLDGHNDLLVDLGTAAGADPNSCHPCNINDDGVILGRGLHPVPDEAPNDFAWILAPKMVDGQLTWADLDTDGVNGLIQPLPVVSDLEDPYLVVLPQHINNHGEVALVVESWNPSDCWQKGFLLLPSHYEVSADGAVTIEYPAADLDGDGLNDYLVDLGMGIRVHDGAVRPLLPTVINDRGDVAGMVWNNWHGDVNGECPFVLRPRVDGEGGRVWNEDSDGDGLNDRVIPLPVPAEIIDAAASQSAASWISDLNENGTIVGSVHYAAPKGSRAAIWQVDWAARTVAYRELEPLGRTKISHAQAVNAAGQVVGRSLRYLSGGYVDAKAWLWDANGATLLCDLVPPETGLADGSSAPTGINDSGMIVGSHEGVAFIAMPVAQP